MNFAVGSLHIFRMNGWSSILTAKWRPTSQWSDRELSIPLHWFAGGLSSSMPVATTLHLWLRTLRLGLSSHEWWGARRSACRGAQLSTKMADHLMGHVYTTSKWINIDGSNSRQTRLNAIQKVWVDLDECRMLLAKSMSCCWVVTRGSVEVDRRNW